MSNVAVLLGGIRAGIRRVPVQKWTDAHEPRLAV